MSIRMSFKKINKIIPLIICISIVSICFTNAAAADPKGERIIKGIVEDNNPQLGYITLYNEDGTGTSPALWEQLTLYRTYNYKDLKNTKVLKNHKKADVYDIEPGDSVFIETDNDGNVLSISGVDSYTIKYATIISKRPSSIAVRYDDGTQQILDIDNSILVVESGRRVDYERLRDGDRIKLILQITNKFTKVKEIVLEDGGRYISNIYKGRVFRIDDTSDKVIVQNLEVLERGKWHRSEQKGFASIKLSEDNNIYFNDDEISIKDINRYLSGNEAYIAVKRDYGGEERAVFVSFRNERDSEVLYGDSVYSASYGKGTFKLVKDREDFEVEAGTIIIKDGRLVTANSIMSRDTAYVVANRNYSSGDYIAGIVQINDRFINNSIQIFRGRIKSIEENREFMVESFSKLDGHLWKYSNTPKTFRITYDTRILDEQGIVNQREFIDYGDDSFDDKVVYIVARDTDALIVSTAPYATYNISGTVYRLDGGEIGEEGSIIEEPDKFSIRKVKVYSNMQNLWLDGKNMTLEILKNSIILKGDNMIKPSELKKGDMVRVLKMDNVDSAAGCIILVEN